VVLSREKGKKKKKKEEPGQEKGPPSPCISLEREKEERGVASNHKKRGKRTPSTVKKREKKATPPKKKKKKKKKEMAAFLCPLNGPVFKKEEKRTFLRNRERGKRRKRKFFSRWGGKGKQGCVKKGEGGPGPFVLCWGRGGGKEGAGSSEG